MQFPSFLHVAGNKCSNRSRLPEPPQNLLELPANAATPYTMPCAVATNTNLTMVLVVVAVTAVATEGTTKLPGYTYPFMDSF